MNACGNCGQLAEWSPEHCPGCGAYRTFLPIDLREQPSGGFSIDVNDLDGRSPPKIPTGYRAWDEALGGGLVLRSSLVLYGPAGSRKSSWAGAIADRVSSSRRGRALDLSAEMPSEQFLDLCHNIRRPLVASSIIGSERDASNVDRCLSEIAHLRPVVVVWDSVQAFDAGGALAGSDLAVKLTVLSARRAAARFGHCAILISQVNKSGEPAGPHRTIHDCDVVSRLSAQTLTVRKNRFAPSPKTVRVSAKAVS